MREPAMPRITVPLFAALASLASGACAQTISTHITSPDRYGEMTDGAPIHFAAPGEQRVAPIVVDPQQRFQYVDGMGFALTWGSAQQLHRMSPKRRTTLLRRLFVDDGISYLRLSIGASDLNSFVYSYDDLPPGQTDPDLRQFSLGHDMDHVVPILKEILAIRPSLTIMASPWSAPTWMKTNGAAKGGALKPEYYPTYGQYLVKYIEAMREQGINIAAITVQNEPLNSGNTPSMPMSWQQQAAFIGSSVGPQIAAAGLKTKIMAFDHNTDRIDYPLGVLSDAAASPYVAGSAFHNYRGDISAMSRLHTARPDKDIFFTEQMVIPRPGSADIGIAGPVRQLVVGAFRNWSRNLILWNLAADRDNGPHTGDGGCSICQGALTIEGDEVTFNLAYSTMLSASRFVAPGSERIFSTAPVDEAVIMTRDESDEQVVRASAIERSGVLPNVAFTTPDGQIVLIVANDGSSAGPIEVQYKGKVAVIPLPIGSVGTFVWRQQ